MRKAAPVLHFISRLFAICACIAGLVGGLFMAWLASAICFDFGHCPTTETFPIWAYTSMRVMMPCVALELLALAAFAPYTIVTGQARRAVRQAAVFLLGGLSGGAVLGALFLLGRANLPLTPYGIFVEGPVETWASLWGVVLLVVAATWSGILASLEWDR